MKSRTYKAGSNFVDYDSRNDFDWLAIVLLPGGEQKKRRFFVVPKDIADKKAFRPRSKYPWDMYWTLDKVAIVLGQYEDNFMLERFEHRAQPA